MCPVIILVDLFECAGMWKGRGGRQCGGSGGRPVAASVVVVMW